MTRARNCVRSEELNYYVNGVGAHPWIPHCRNGPARGTCNRLVGDDLFPGKQICTEAQWRLSDPISGGGYSAYQMVFRSKPADRFGWEDKDEDLLYAQGASPSGHCLQQWKMRVMAQGGGSEGGGRRQASKTAGA